MRRFAAFAMGRLTELLPEKHNTDSLTGLLRGGVPV